MQRGDGGVIRGTLRKNRNGSCDRDIAFTIEVEDGGADDDGDMITLPRCNELNLDPFDVKLNPKERTVARIMQRLVSEAAERNPDRVGLIQIAESILREECCMSGVLSGSESRDSRVKAYKRAFDALARQGILSGSTDHLTGDAMVYLNPFNGLSDFDLDPGQARTRRFVRTIQKQGYPGQTRANPQDTLDYVQYLEADSATVHFIFKPGNRRAVKVVFQPNSLREPRK